MEVVAESPLWTQKIICENYRTDWHVEPDFCVYVFMYKANGRVFLSEKHISHGYRDSVTKLEIKRNKVRF